MAKNVFNTIQSPKPRHSMFDLSYDHKLSFKMGKLVPVHLQECVPGDHFRMSSEAMFRMMPMLAPIMHKVDVYMHCFFVPNRIVWPNWEKYITGGETFTGTPVVPPSFPRLVTFGSGSTHIFAPSSLGDYLGVPTGIEIDTSYGNTVGVNAIPFAAYQRIYHEFYRDQNLIGANLDPVTLSDGAQSLAEGQALVNLQNRAWEHDYFTSCLPFAQKGDAVTLPLEFGDAFVKLDTSAPGNFQSWVDNTTYATQANETAGSDGAGRISEAGTANIRLLDPENSMYVDGQDLVTTATINDLRSAMAIQKWLEKNARGGSRYIESLLVHFGVRSSDKRLQRPEYLGGSKSTMAISEVLQTSATGLDATVDTPQGTMAGHGISVNGGRDFSYFCEEHGFIMCILSVRPKTSYYQGTPRTFLKINDRTEFYWPDFAFLGEQPVYRAEVVTQDGDAVTNFQTFGYIPRYSEYRYNAGRVSGQMRTSLDFWHLGRKFDLAFPALLNKEFIDCVPDKRIFAVDDPAEDEIVGHIFHKILAKRPIPKYGTPGSL